MRRAFAALLLVLILGSTAYTYRTPVTIYARQLYDQVLPCARPITYSIGTIDSRFGISTPDVKKALSSASHIWDTPAGRSLFEYVPSGGTVTVNFIYDDRQKTTIKLRSLGISISGDKASYDMLSAAYKKLFATYSSEKQQLIAQNSVLERDFAAYQAEVARVNARGGATPAEFDKLQSTKAALLARQNALQKFAARVNADADDVNAMVVTLNRLASLVNADASVYNSAAKSTGQEFEEAVFQSSAGHSEINVYEYDSAARLKRVLAHEFGHALGLQHVDDKDAIMYRLNQSSNNVPTKADIAELRSVCRMQ